MKTKMFVEKMYENSPGPQNNMPGVNNLLVPIYLVVHV
jgi:hypothetical protein